MKYITFVAYLSIVVLYSGIWISWNIPWVDLIERSEWWADESLKYRNSTKLQSAFDHPEYNIWRIAGKWSLELLDPESVEDIVDRGNTIRTLLSSLPWYFPQVVTNFVENDNLLSRPHKYTAIKKSITVHHTADGKQYRFPSDSLDWLREVYRQHTVSNQRWDIWYNFLIDPQGHVYEWRSWWAWVVGWHANLWNSITSLWIALLWNFENVHPTSAAIHSLTNLSTVLTHQYSITPTNSVQLFDTISESPFIEAHIHDDAIVWHKDIKSTACPWEYLYSKIPWLIDEVTARLKRINTHIWSRNLVEGDFLKIQRGLWSNDRVWWFTIPWAQPVTSASCTLFSNYAPWIICSPVPWWVRIQLSYTPQSSWWHSVGIVTDKGVKIVSFSVVREQDMEDKVVELKNAFELPLVWTNQKMVDYILKNQVEQYLQQDISVLLYEPTRSQESNILCETWCDITIDSTVSIKNAQTVIIRQEWESIVWFIDLQRYDADKITVRDQQWWVVQITNYNRYSWDQPLNIYAGELSFEIQPWRDLDQWITKWFTVVNTLPFKRYIQWMGESSESQHFEKTKALALLTKMYALFYRSWKNPHPSIPQWVSYTAIDDPRSFQRYVWAWIEPLSPYWLQAVDATYTIAVLYEWFVPILPYYHCSWWFSRSWLEKFWRSDTPWLTSKKDVVLCESGIFQWHWVWMSWDGAEYLAQQGATAHEILEWWYEGIDIIRL